ncbi:hypothetical protein VCHENC02_2432B, partial [Vibrio harveyi]
SRLSKLEDHCVAFQT